jgi:hypothetical protein
MYNTYYKCSYFDDDKIFLPSDQVNDTEKYIVKDMLYKQDLLNIFGLSEFDEEAINDEIHQLYKKVIKHDDVKNIAIKNIAIKLANKCMTTDPEIGFILLFSFDYLYITHTAICEFLDSGTISDTTIQQLDNIIE